MKLDIAAFGLLATLLSTEAYAYHPLRHTKGHFQYLNKRTNYTEPHTTLTVVATEIHTVISCAPTVTNCPANPQNIPQSDQSVATVTDTVVLKTTVCPVKDASSISASVVQQHSSSKLSGNTITAPRTTATAEDVAVPDSTSAAGGIADEGIPQTVGSDSTDADVTTTVQYTIHTTVTVTQTVSHHHAPTATATAELEDSTTTTITRTHTSTRTIYLEHATHSSKASVPSGSGEDGGECSAVTVTVTADAHTVTVPAKTVYVTLSPHSSAVSEPGAHGSVLEEDDGSVSVDRGGGDGGDGQKYQLSGTTIAEAKTTSASGTTTPTPAPTPSPVSLIHPLHNSTTISTAYLRPTTTVGYNPPGYQLPPLQGS